MIWALGSILAIALAPFLREWLRPGMGRGARARAPGHFAKLSQGLTHFDWIGPEEGSPLVCIHGLTTPSYVWRALAPLLAVQGFRVLIYDLYGRGFSDRPRGRQSREFFLRQLEELLEAEEVRGPVTLAGYSMGGAIATSYAARHPTKVTRLILLAPAGMAHSIDRLSERARDLWGVGDWLFRLLWPRRFKQAVTEDPRPSQVDNIAARQQEEVQYRGFTPAVLSSYRGMLSKTQEAEHRAVQRAAIPVLAIWGAEDDVIPLSAMGRLTQWNRACRQEVIDGAAHGLPYTHADAVAEVVAETLVREGESKPSLT